MDDYIPRKEAIIAVCRARLPDTTEDGIPIANGKRSVTDCVRRLKEIPAADVRPVVKAKWEDVHIDRPEIADIEVATMFCPHCNRWHNEVYQYGNPIEFANYCSFCGASMKEES